MSSYNTASYTSPSTSDVPASATAGPPDLAKKAYAQPEVETIGSVPQITGGSDIFGDGPR